FKAEVCVEIRDIKLFCTRAVMALPPAVTFPEIDGRPKIGHAVTYYRETDNCTPRWASPDRLALSKLNHFAWQNEFRFAFSLTDAFRYQNIVTKLVQQGAVPLRN